MSLNNIRIIMGRDDACAQSILCIKKIPKKKHVIDQLTRITNQKQ